MKKNDVVVGGVYKVKVGRNVVEIRLDAENPRGGWDAVSLATGKPIRVKSAQRLRGAANSPRSAQGAGCEAEAADPSPLAPAAPEGRPVATDPAPRADGKLSGLDAAAKVLAEAGEPMNCKALVDCMLAKGLWTTGGKTPAATIYAAILREIQAKGERARFRKVERGKFSLAS